MDVGRMATASTVAQLGARGGFADEIPRRLAPHRLRPTSAGSRSACSGRTLRAAMAEQLDRRLDGGSAVASARSEALADRTSFRSARVAMGAEAQQAVAGEELGVAGPDSPLERSKLHARLSAGALEVLAQARAEVQRRKELAAEQGLDQTILSPTALGVPSVSGLTSPVLSDGSGGHARAVASRSRLAALETELAAEATQGAATPCVGAPPADDAAYWRLASPSSWDAGAAVPCVGAPPADHAAYWRPASSSSQDAGAAVPCVGAPPADDAAYWRPASSSRDAGAAAPCVGAPPADDVACWRPAPPSWQDAADTPAGAEARVGAATADDAAYWRPASRDAADMGTGLDEAHVLPSIGHSTSQASSPVSEAEGAGGDAGERLAALDALRPATAQSTPRPPLRWIDERAELSEAACAGAPEDGGALLEEHGRSSSSTCAPLQRSARSPEGGVLRGPEDPRGMRSAHGASPSAPSELSTSATTIENGARRARARHEAGSIAESPPDDVDVGGHGGVLTELSDAALWHHAPSPATSRRSGAAPTPRSRPGTVASASASARGALEAELAGRLRALELAARSRAAKELRAELERVSCEHPVAALHAVRAIAEKSLEDSLRHELQEAVSGARFLWATVGHQDHCVQELEAGLAVVDDCAAARAECEEAAEAIGRAQTGLREAQERSLRLDGRRRQLRAQLRASEEAAQRSHLELQAIEGEQHHGDALACTFPQLTGDVRRTAMRLAKRSQRLEAQSRKLAEQTAEAKARMATLEWEAERLQEDRRAAMAWLREQAAERAGLQERIAMLAIRGGLPGASLEEVAGSVGADWAEVWRILEAREREWQAVEARRERLFRDLTKTQQALELAAEAADRVERDFAVREEERRVRERYANEELSAARAEHRSLRQAQAEWQQRRPQLVDLIEELRFGNREGTASYNELVDRLATLQASVNRWSSHPRSGRFADEEGMDDG